MPELPEVETIARRLRTVLPNKTISSVLVNKKKSFGGDPTNLTGISIVTVSRRAKMIQVDLSNDTHLLVHLKMTGQLIYIDDRVRLGGGHPTADWTKSLPNSHTRVQMHLSDGSTLFFNDQRIFGWIRHMTGEQMTNEYTRYGPDITDSSVNTAYVVQKAASRTVAIKQFLLDQKVMAGVGNIYACDALNLAQIHPKRPTNMVTGEELERLLNASKEVIQRGIKHGGASIETYVTAEGLTGTYQEVRLVYARAGEACKNCGGSIKKITVGGRGTYYCPNCQV